MAVQALYQWQVGGDGVADIEAQFRAEYDAKSTDIAYFHELLTGVPRLRDGLEAALQPCLDRPFEQVDAVERAILWVGSYELEARQDVPYRVIINEAVELARTFGGENAHRYVNAVLDRLAGRVRAVEVALPRPDAC